MNQFSAGDKVTWNSRNGKTQGKIIRKIERETTVAGHKVNASKDDPQYLVQSEKTGSRATHKPDALSQL